MERKLTAIFCADVFGYSRLTGEDEEATHRTLRSYRQIIVRVFHRALGKCRLLLRQLFVGDLLQKVADAVEARLPLIV